MLFCIDFQKITDFYLTSGIKEYENLLISQPDSGFCFILLF